VPQALPLHPVPDTLQVTSVFVVPVTFAVNCCCLLSKTCTEAGDTLTTTKGSTVTVAEFDLVESATDVALMLTFAGFGTLVGAVYTPLVPMVPQALPVQPVPDTLHVTLVFVDPVTVAVNCRCLPTTTCAEVGEIFIATDGTIVAIAVLSFVGSAAEVAVTLTCGGPGTAAGAVYNPPELIVPQAFPVQPAPVTTQVTLVFVEPVTVALNCCCLPATT